MTRHSVLFFLFFLVINYSFCQEINLNYFGEKPPVEEAKIFAPDFISVIDRIDGRGSFSPDGKQFYFTVSDNSLRNQKIFFTEYKNGDWTQPDTAEFSKEYSNWEPFFSFDGEKLFFTSNRNPDTLSNHKDFYYVTRQESGWTEPKILAGNINSLQTDLFFCQSEKGNIYFSSARPGGKGATDIYVAKGESGSYEIENLGKPINHFLYDWDPCIAPDESYMIFTAVRLARAGRKSDLYITFNENGKWTRPKNFGKIINTKLNEYAPFLSPDGKYLFFSRLGKGSSGDIYWISTEIIKNYKK